MDFIPKTNIFNSIIFILQIWVQPSKYDNIIIISYSSNTLQCLNNELPILDYLSKIT